MKEIILSIHVELDECFEVRGGAKNVNLVNFHGTARSKFFSGEILSGGVDTQLQRAGEHKQLSARKVPHYPSPGLVSLPILPPFHYFQ